MAGVEGFLEGEDLSRALSRRQRVKQEVLSVIMASRQTRLSEAEALYWRLMGKLGWFGGRVQGGEEIIGGLELEQTKLK